MWLVFCCYSWMNKTLNSQAKNDLIVPFEEKPAPGKFSQGEEKQIPAVELFNLFTADIITENRIFVR